MSVYYIPFFGALSEAVGTIIEKQILRRKKVDQYEYNFFGFLMIILMLIPIIFLLWRFFPQNFPVSIDSEAFSLLNIGIFLGVIILSLAANLFTFYALKWEKVTEIEPLRLLQPLFAIFFAFILFSSERHIKTGVIIAAIIAASALLFAHIKKHHFQFNKFAIAAALGSLFFALELVFSNFILQYYPPLVFYFIRCLGILIISLMLYEPSLETIDKKTWRLITGVSFIWILYRLLLYSSYLTKGPIITTLLFMLTPVFIYIFSRCYLKEKLSWKNILASIIILICVGYALYVNGN